MSYKKNYMSFNIERLIDTRVIFRCKSTQLARLLHQECTQMEVQ
jgi:hypothetical protein